MNCILCDKAAIAGLKYCPVHKARADKQTLAEKLAEQRAVANYSVVESKVWQHKTTGRKVSPYGACPWTSDAEKTEWELVPQGWTLFDRQSNTVGCGRVPWPTREAAQSQADEWNARRAVTYGR
jgi:hypothetical protein